MAYHDTSVETCGVRFDGPLARWMRMVRVPGVPLVTRRPLVVLLAASCASPAPAPAPVAPGAPIGPVTTSTAAALPAAEPVQQDEDTIHVRGSGASVPVPKRWFRTELGDQLLLEDPEKSVRVVLIEVDGDDAAAVIAGLWKRVDDNLPHAVEQTTKPPPTDGFDEVVVQKYVSRTGGGRAEQAIVHRLGHAIYAFLIEGSKAGLDRRGAQIRSIAGGLKVPGQKKDDLSGKPMVPLDGVKLEAFIEEARVKSGIQGVSVAVIQDGRVVFEKGFGVREAGKKSPVTPDTLMMIGSITKSMTTLLMATLADDGKIRWDTRVAEVLPGFSLGDPSATTALTIQHTVCACTGMPRRDLEFLFEFDRSTAETLIASMRTVAPTTGFGETYQYSNQMVAIGGYAAARAAQAKGALGPAYEAAMAARVFGPLGMKRTTLSHERAARDRDRATPHGRDIEWAARPIPIGYERMVEALDPSGGVWSTARDMSRYVIAELSRGALAGGKRVATEDNLTRRWQPQVEAGTERWYGLGWGIGKHRGLDIIEHDGGTFGFNAKAAFLPAKGLGIVVLANTTACGAFLAAVRSRVIELVFAADEKAAARLDFDLAALRGQLDVIRAKIAPADLPWMQALLGVYRHPTLGEVSLKRRGEDIILDAGEWSSRALRIVEPDGAVKLLLADPPLLAVDLLPGVTEGRATLSIETPQETYQLIR